MSTRFLSGTPAIPSRITVPEHCHPLARLVFQLMKRHGVTYSELEWVSGVIRQTLKSYRNEKIPSLRTAEALLGAFGWSLVPVPPLSSLKPETLAAIEEISLNFRTDDEVIGAALLSIAAPRSVADDSAQARGIPTSDLRCAA